MKKDKPWLMSDDDLRRAVRVAHKTWGMFRMLTRMADIPRLKLRNFMRGHCSLDPVKRQKLTNAVVLIKSGKAKIKYNKPDRMGKVELKPMFEPVYREVHEIVAPPKPLIYTSNLIKDLAAQGKGQRCLFTTTGSMVTVR